MSEPVDPCPRCGAMLRPGAAACGHCGLRTRCVSCAAPLLDPLRDRFCATCGEPVADSAPIGASVRATAPSDPPAAESQPVSSSRRVAGSAAALATRGGRRAGLDKMRGRVDVPRRLQRAARRTLTRAAKDVGDCYLELSYSLLKAGRDAEPAFDEALREGITNVFVLDDVLEAALEKRKVGIAARACLELAARDPGSLDEDELRAIVAQVDDRTAEKHGRWIVERWQVLGPDKRATPSVRALCALLVARVAELIPDPAALLHALEVARAAHPGLTDEHVDYILRDDALSPQLRRQRSPAYALLARANVVVGRDRAALFQVERALDAGVPEGDDGTAMLKLRAELLDRSGAKTRAAEAYIELGRHHELSSAHHEGALAFRRACELDEASAVAHWYLADAERLAGATGEFPYIDPPRAEAARAAWETGMQLRTPDAPYAWVHLSGALIAEVVALGAPDPSAEIELAALHAERAVALEPASGHGWALVSRYHRLLGHAAVARHAAEHASRMAPQSRSAQSERAFVAVEQADERAGRLIDAYAERFGAALEPRLIAERGHLMLLVGELDAACDQLGRALETDPSDVQARVRLALCRELQGRGDEARNQALRVLAETEPGAPRAAPVHDQDRALAALLARQEQQAENELASSLGAVWTNDIEIRMGLALAAALRGDLEACRQRTADAVDAVAHPGDARLLLLYLKLLERWAPPELATHARERAVRVEAGLEAYRLPDVLAELSALASAQDRGSPAWLVVELAQGRVLALEERWSEAVDADEALLEFTDPLLGAPAARARLVESLRHLRDEAVEASEIPDLRQALSRLTELGAISSAQAALELAAALQSSDPAEALREAERGGQLADDGSDDGSRLQARLAQGDALMHANRGEAARKRYDAALAASAPGGERAKVLAHLAVLAGHEHALGDAVRRLREAIAEFDEPALVRFGARSLLRECEAAGGGLETPSLAPAFRLLTASGALTGQQRGALLAARFAARRASREVEPVPPVDPIKMEVGPGLAAALAHADGHGHRSVEALRARLLGVTGVRIPGIVISVDDLLEPDRYRLLINEIPYLTGEAPREGGLALVGPTGDGSGVENPWSGVTAGWRVPARRGDLGPLEGALWVLEGLLRVHLATFVGTSETDYQVNEWVAAGRRDRAALVKRAVPDRRARAALAVVLRRLVRQQVPVNDLGAIIRVVNRRRPADTPTTLVESARRALADVLPRPSRVREALPLPADLAREIERLDAAVGADPVSSAVDGLRELVGTRCPGAFVITVATPSLRVRVQHLSRRVLPSTAVVSAAELSATDGGGR